MNCTYLPHRDFKYRFSKPCKKAIVTELQYWILSNFYRLKRLWRSLPSSASSTVVRYLWDIFVMYSGFVGGNCRYVGISDV